MIRQIILLLALSFAFTSYAKRTPIYYEYRGNDYTALLALYTAVDGMGIFKYARTYHCTHCAYHYSPKTDTLFYHGFYIQKSDSTIEMCDVNRKRAYNATVGRYENFKELREDKVSIDLGSAGAGWRYDCYGITATGDTLVYLDQPYRFFIDTCITKFYVILREERSPFGPVATQDCSIRYYDLPSHSVKKDFLSIFLYPELFPTIEHDIWIIREDEVVPLENDYRTYSKKTLKHIIPRRKTTMLFQ